MFVWAFAMFYAHVLHERAWQCAHVNVTTITQFAQTLRHTLMGLCLDIFSCFTRQNKKKIVGALVLRM